MTVPWFATKSCALSGTVLALGCALSLYGIAIGLVLAAVSLLFVVPERKQRPRITIATVICIAATLITSAWWFYRLR